MINVGSELKKIFQSVLGLSHNFSDNATIESVQSWDSLSHINLIFAIEEFFNININEEEMIQMNNYETIVNIVSEKVNS